MEWYIFKVIIFFLDFLIFYFLHELNNSGKFGFSEMHKYFFPLNSYTQLSKIEEKKNIGILWGFLRIELSDMCYQSEKPWAQLLYHY